MEARVRIRCDLRRYLGAAVVIALAGLSGCGLGSGNTGGGVHGANQPTDLAHAAIATFIDKEAPPGQSGGGRFNSTLRLESAQAAVTLTEPLDAYQYSPNGTFPSDRPEYARRDPALCAGTPGPLRASAQWPTPAAPRQRPFPFRFWRYQ